MNSYTLRLGQTRERERERVNAGSDIPVLLQTTQRLGCFAVALVTRSPDGSRLVDMTHYDPLSNHEHLRVLRELIATHPSGDHTVFLLHYLAETEPETIAILQLLQQFCSSPLSYRVSNTEIGDLDEYLQHHNEMDDQLVFVANKGKVQGHDEIKVGGRQTLKIWEPNSAPFK